MSRTFEVSPARVTAQPEALGAFLSTLGLTPVQAADLTAYRGRGGQVLILAAGAGDVEPGRSTLAFTVDDLPAAAEQLGAAGHPVVRDEHDGWPASVQDPQGRRIGLTDITTREQQGSLPHAASASMDVVARYPSSDPEGDAGFFAALGLVGGAVDDPWPYGLRTMDHRGVVSLDADFSNHSPAAGGWTPVRIGFETSEPLDALAGRLRAAGYDTATVLDDGPAPYVDVVDPDGRHVEIHLTA